MLLNINSTLSFFAFLLLAVSAEFDFVIPGRCSSCTRGIKLLNPFDHTMYSIMADSGKVLNDNCQHQRVSNCTSRFIDLEMECQVPFDDTPVTSPLNLNTLPNSSPLHFVKNKGEFMYYQEMKLRLETSTDYNMSMCEQKENSTDNHASELFSSFVDGDEQFCSVVTCNKKSNTYCSVYSLKNSTFIITADGAYRPECFGTTYLPIRGHNRQKKESGFNTGNSCPLCSATCKGHTVSATSSRPFTSSRICTHQICDERPYLNSVHQVDASFPKEIFTKESHFRIQLWIDDVEQVFNLECEEADRCDVLDCLFCAEAWIKIDCLSVLQMLVVMLSIGLITTLASYFWIHILSTYNPLRVPFRLLVKLTQFLRRTTLRWWRAIKEMADDNNEQASQLEDVEVTTPGSPRFEEQSESDATSISSQNLVRPTRRARQVTYMSKFGPRTKFVTAISFLVCLAAADQTMTVSNSQCTQMNDKTETCNVVASSRIAVAPVGQTSTISLLKQDGQRAGLIELITESLQYECQENILYYTYQSVVKCDHVLDCRILGCKCPSQQEINDNLPERFQAQHALLTNYECRKNCGPGCGCLATNTGCNNYWYGLRNRDGLSRRVSTCTLWLPSAKVTLKITSEGAATSIVRDLSLRAGVKVTESGVTVGLVSLAPPIMPILNGCFIKTGDKTALVQCSKGGELVQGQIGEIQCPDEESARLGAKECFSNLNNIKIGFESPESITCTGAVIEIDGTSKDRMLPQSFQGVNLFTSNSSIIASLQGITELELQVDAKDLKMVVVRQDSSCKVKYVKSSGCYQCQVGAGITFEIQTDFGSTSAVVICKGLGISQPMRADPVSTKMTLTFSYDKECFKDICTITCPKSESNLEVSGCLEYVPLVNSLNSSVTTNTTKAEVDTEGTFFSSLFNMPFAIWGFLLGLSWKTFLAIGAGLVACVLAAAAAWYLLPMYLARKGMSVAAKLIKTA